MRSFKIIVKGKSYTVEIGDLSKSPISVTVNGESFEVELERETPKVETAAPVITPLEREIKVEPTSAAPERAKVKAIPGAATAPMPGKIVAISVNVGDQVSYGDELCILEAMKMEQSIKATQNGVVKAIRVTVGQSVAYGDVLIEFG